MPATTTAPSTEEGAAYLDVILLALKLLGQRTIAALDHALPLLALGTGFWLWLSVMPQPSYPQLGGLALYAAFTLLMLIVTRR